MKRTVPLFITAIVGFVMIVAFFIPATERWGEAAAIWFDLLAAIAFILGGGNLMKTHLKKISDRVTGWGYSAITIASFLVMLIVGLTKWGSPPAPNQEYYGQTFAHLPVAAFPIQYQVPGSIPKKENESELPPAVQRQVSADTVAGTISFRGWMLPNQRAALAAFKDELQWRCTAEKLFNVAQPPEALRGKVFYYADLEMLSFAGQMTEAARDELLTLTDSPMWREAVKELYEKTSRKTEIHADPKNAPANLDTEVAGETIAYDANIGTLSIIGPMSTAQRDALAAQFPLAKPLEGAPRVAFFDDLRSRGPLNEKQVEAANRVLDATWTAEQLRTTLDQAGGPQEVNKTACEMYEEMQAGVELIVPTKTVGEDHKLNDAQVSLLSTFAGNDWTADELVERLRAAGPLAPRQEAAVRGFLSKLPTVGEQKKEIAFQMLGSDAEPDGPLTAQQSDWLFDEYRRQVAWRKSVGALFIAAHEVKFPWSGEYLAEGHPFWWLYRYAFTPLTATMFALLAFYVASAAFRAFRAKNVEAILLLTTAFIILLGRTAAGVALTGWIDPQSSFAALRMENLTVDIMRVIVTTGNRAIMLGVALGIASTSLRVLLGIDRSYLGSAEE